MLKTVNNPIVYFWSLDNQVIRLTNRWVFGNKGAAKIALKHYKRNLTQEQFDALELKSVNLEQFLVYKDG